VILRRALLTAAALATLCASPALAHRGHAGLTVVEIAADGGVSVVHRFAAHDVEPALVSIAPGAQPTLDDPAAVAALEAHVGSHFRLDVGGQTLALRHVETRLAGDQVRLDFAGAANGPVETVTVDLDFFPGVHDDQEQQVNVRIGGVTRSVVFRPGSQAQTVSFAS